MENEPEKSLSFLFAAMFELSIGVFAVILSNLGGAHSHETMPTLSQPRELSKGLVGGVLIGTCLAVGLTQLERFRWHWLQQASDLAEKHLTPLIRNCNISQLIVLSLTAGVGEELLFRGWLQGTLVRELEVFGWVGVGFAIVLASLAFGIAHPLSHGYIYVAAALGIVFGITVYLSQNLFMAIIGHTVYDAILMILFAKKLKAQSASP